MHLALPPPEAMQSKTGIRRSYVGILSHRPKNPRDKSAIKLLICWTEGDVSWEPLEFFEKECHWAVFHYAERHGLLKERYWKTIICWGQKHLPPLFLNARVDEKARKDEEAFSETRNWMKEVGLIEKPKMKSGSGIAPLDDDHDG